MTHYNARLVQADQTIPPTQRPHAVTQPDTTLRTRPGNRPQAKIRNAVLITGMHRSGTSALARTLNLLGADLGAGLLSPRQDNPRGYWEAGEVIALNDECLAHFDTAWHDPRPLPSGWEDDAWVRGWRERLVELLHQRHGDAPCIVIKDPRISRLLPVWLDALRTAGFAPGTAIMLRHPDEVTASLEERGDHRISPDTARLLWLRYLVDAELGSRDIPRAMVTYPELVHDWPKVKQRLDDALQIDWPRTDTAVADDIDAFIDPILHRQRAGDRPADRSSRLATRCARLYGDIVGTLPQLSLHRFDAERERLADDLELARATRLPVDQPQPDAGNRDSLWWAPSATQPLRAQLFFPHADGRYDQDQSMEVTSPPTPGVRRVCFDVPGGTGPRRVRFDPAKAPGTYRLHSLAINGHRVPANECVVLAVGGTRLDDDGGAVCLHAHTDDPWIELSLDGLLPEQDRLHTLEIAFERDAIPDRLNRGMESLAARQGKLADKQSRDMDSLLARQNDVVRDSARRIEVLAHEASQATQQRQGALETKLETSLNQANARDATIEQLRETSYAALLASYAGASAHRTPPRGRARLQLEPRQDLRLLAQYPGNSLRAWRCEGEDPWFAISWRGGKPFPPGWYIVRLAMQSIKGTLATPHLYVDYGDGLNEVNVMGLALTRDSLRQRPLVHFDKPVKALRLDPSPEPGERDFLLDNCLSLRAIPAPEALLRVGLSRVRVMRHHGARWREVGAEIAKTLRHRKGTVLDTLHANARLEDPGASSIAYAAWVARSDTIDDAERRRIDADIDSMTAAPVISVIVPVYNTNEAWLRTCIESVLGQRYPHWQLCIANDASTKPHVQRILDEYADGNDRIRVVHRDHNGHISAASNSALDLATGDWVAFLDHDDELREHALYHIAACIRANPDAQLIYSDEDKIREDGTRYDPYFKPDWNPELFLSQNYLCHLVAYRTSRVNKAGGCRVGFEGSQDHDLGLRIVQHLEASQIVHIPRILYHWRAVSGSTARAAAAKTYTQDAGLRAIQDHLRCLGLDSAKAIRTGDGYYRVRYPLPDPAPKVSLIIPTRDRVDLLRTSVDSILELTDYPNYEILIVDNGSSDPETLTWLEDTSRREPRVRVLRDDRPFNFSRINNAAVAEATGSIIGLINNDIEAIHTDWLTEMTSHAAHDGVGAVGAKLYYPDNTIQHAGVILGIGGVAGHAYLNKPRNHHGQMGRANLVQNLSAVTAACLVVKKSAYEAVGGMNENLEIAFNDIDFCLRLLNAGYRNVWTPFAELVHHESASRGYEDTPEKQARFAEEINKMQDIWGELLQHDPAYNTNFSLSGEAFATLRDSTPETT